MQALIEKRYPPDRYSYSNLKQLVLDSYRIKQISKEDGIFLGTFNNLNYLSCSATALVSLENFPYLPLLTKLELQDNALSSSSHLDILATSAPILKILRLGGNRLKNVEQLITDLAPLKHLETLDIDMNIFCDTENQRMDSETVRIKLFEGMPQLKLIDRRDSSGIEHHDDDDKNDDDEQEDDDDEQEDDDDEDYSQQNDDQEISLKEFYENDIRSNNDEDDDESDFNPLNQIEDEDGLDDEDDYDDDEEEKENEEEEEEQEEEEENDFDEDSENMQDKDNQFISKPHLGKRFSDDTETKNDLQMFAKKPKLV